MQINETNPIHPSQKQKLPLSESLNINCNYIHTIYFKKSIQVHYPFSVQQLEKYEDKFNWYEISQNNEIYWDFETIKRFEKKLVWSCFSLNRTFENVELIDIFFDHIDWVGEIDCSNMTICSNPYIKWNIDLLKKYEHVIDFDILSENEYIEWTLDMIETYRVKLDFDYLLANENLPWSVDFIEKYYPEQNIFDNFSCKRNNNIYGNYTILEKYNEIMDWFYISRNSQLPWKDKGILYEWTDKINWSGIGLNEYLISQKGFIETFENELIEGNCLSGNNGTFWSEKIIDKYIDHWDWYNLSNNHAVPWSEALIEKYKHKLHWGNHEIEDENIISINFGLCSNPGVKWTKSILEKYYHKFEPEMLAFNESLWDCMFKGKLSEEDIRFIFEKSDY
jgi:hypothetical protein